MKTKHIIISLTTIFFILLSACNSEAQNSQSTNTTSVSTAIEVIQFHSEHRCMTCNKIEELTRESLKSYPNLPFSLINVDDKKNEKKAEEFEATGTALFLYDPKTGIKKDLTDFAFMNAFDEEKFKEGLHKKIDEFIKP